MSELERDHDAIEIEQFEDDFDIQEDTEQIVETVVSSNNYLNDKLNEVFAGKIVRKDLTKKIKEGANVPVYVLEYLLGMYCATTEEEAIADGVRNVKSILAENFVRPDEAQKIISKLRERGSYTDNAQGCDQNCTRGTCYIANSRCFKRSNQSTCRNT